MYILKCSFTSHVKEQIGCKVLLLHSQLILQKEPFSSVMLADKITERRLTTSTELNFLTD